MNSSARFEEIEWDGNSIWLWIVTDSARIRCEVPRVTIHGMWLFHDAIAREIARDRSEIVDRLRTVILAKLTGAEQDRTIKILPTDLDVS
jgi:hypothetical protein